MEKYGTVVQATDDSKIRRKRLGCSVTAATDTTSSHAMIIAADHMTAANVTIDLHRCRVKI